MDEEDFDYTIAICNYEMADTLRESLESIIWQVNDDFEILVVDDGSSDGSVEILRDLERQYSNFRLYEGNNENLAEARNCSFRQATGTYIIESVDVDDKYRNIVEDFVRIYHAIEEARDDDFYLWGHSINMAPRQLLLEYPYRSLGYGEDKDLWRRLAAADKLVLLAHDSPCDSIGYNRNARQMLNIWFESTVVEFQTGITPSSFATYNIKEILRNNTLARKEAIFNLLSLPVAYIKSRFEPHYEPVEGFERFGNLKQMIRTEEMTLSEIESEYGFEMDREGFSKDAYDVFVSYDKCKP